MGSVQSQGQGQVPGVWCRGQTPAGGRCQVRCGEVRGAEAAHACRIMGCRRRGGWGCERGGRHMWHVVPCTSHLRPKTWVALLGAQCAVHQPAPTTAAVVLQSLYVQRCSDSSSNSTPSQVCATPSRWWACLPRQAMCPRCTPSWGGCGSRGVPPLWGLYSSGRGGVGLDSSYFTRTRTNQACDGGRPGRPRARLSVHSL